MHLNSTWDFPEGQVTISQYILRIFYSRMFLWVENGTWPSLDPRQDAEVVSMVWNWKKSLGSLTGKLMDIGERVRSRANQPAM